MDDAVNDERRRVLVLNCGSSSVKAACFGVHGDHLERGETAQVKAIGPDARLQCSSASGDTSAAVSALDHETALEIVLARLAGDADAVGHRIVHGGASRAGPALVDDGLVDELRRLTPLAPLHQAAGLRGIALARERLPAVPQVACFDTSFHRSMPAVAQRLALPASLHELGVRRYGFHGLSCEHVVHAIGAATLGRAIVAHLGAGASLTAIDGGRSVDTTMGFTPSGGMLMATRLGDIDPSVLVYLLDQLGYDAAGLQQLIEHDSGMKGVSGTSGDMQTLLAAPADPAAVLAVELFCRDARKHVGALAAVLGGLDTLVFTGGIGEHAASVRAAICEPLASLGITLDPARNEHAEPVISRTSSRCTVRVVPADEESVIARRTSQLAFGV